MPVDDEGVPEVTKERGSGHWANLDYHRRLLQDVVRMEAYERAIRAIVKPGDVVLDLGAGSGILAMLAARRGAARVHAVESTPIIELAEKVINANDLSDRVVLHNRDIRSMEPAEPVDLVISDFMGRFVVDDDMLPAVAAALRWLKPGGSFCPRVIDLWLAPVGNFELDTVKAFDRPIYGLDFSAAKPYALNFCYGGDVPPHACMARPQTCHRLDPLDLAYDVDSSLRFEVTTPGTICALAGWFQAELAEGVVLETGPGQNTHWGQYLFPLPTTRVKPGDSLIVQLSFGGGEGDGLRRWRGHLEPRGTGESNAVAPFALQSRRRFGQSNHES